MKKVHKIIFGSVIGAALVGIVSAIGYNQYDYKKQIKNWDRAGYNHVCGVNVYPGSNVSPTVKAATEISVAEAHKDIPSLKHMVSYNNPSHNRVNVEVVESQHCDNKNFIYGNFAQLVTVNNSQYQAQICYEKLKGICQARNVKGSNKVCKVGIWRLILHESLHVIIGPNHPHNGHDIMGRMPTYTSRIGRATKDIMKKVDKGCR